MQPLWRSIVADIEVKARPQCIWTKVLDYVGPSRKLRLQATGSWIWQEAPRQDVRPDPDTAAADLSANQVTNTAAANPVAAGGNRGSSTQQSTAQSQATPESARNPAKTCQPTVSAPLTSLVEVGVCGPDGDIHSATSADSLMPDALQGALIGKIGGSSAAIKNIGAFVVGSHCVLEIDDKLKGPLYLTINDTCSGMQDNSGSVHVSIWEAL